MHFSTTFYITVAIRTAFQKIIVQHIFSSHSQWRTLHEILGGRVPGFISPCHGRGVRGHALMGKF